MQLDPSRCWSLIDARRRREHDPVRRRNLDNLREFWRAVVSGDLVAAMQITAADIRIVAHGNASEMLNAEGREAAERYFEWVVEAGVNRIEYEVDDLLVDDEGACTAGRVRIPYPGGMLRVMGHDVDDPDAFYLYETRVLMIWAIDEQGRVREQASYAAGDGFSHIHERKLAPGAILKLDAPATVPLDGALAAPQSAASSSISSATSTVSTSTTSTSSGAAGFEER